MSVNPQFFVTTELHYQDEWRASFVDIFVPMKDKKKASRRQEMFLHRGKEAGVKSFGSKYNRRIKNIHQERSKIQNRIQNKISVRNGFAEEQDWQNYVNEEFAKMMDYEALSMAIEFMREQDRLAEKKQEQRLEDSFASDVDTWDLDPVLNY